MSTSKEIEAVQPDLSVNGIDVQIVRKPIKNLHLGVYPPHGRVRVAAPPHITDENIRLAVISKLGWIKRQQASFLAQERQSEREMVRGESHYLWGRRYLLDVVEQHGRHEVSIRNNKWMQLSVRPGTTVENRRLVLQEWYRAQIKERVPALLAHWEPIIGKEATSWGVKKMKTKWGSCNIAAGRVWLNLELAKKPPECLTYILVHELVHLHERHHNMQFKAYMDQFMPQWRLYRDRLNQSPLAHEHWDY